MLRLKDTVKDRSYLLDDFGILLQVIDERQERVPVEPIHVQVLRWPVGREHDNHPKVAESSEKSLEDHSVSDVEHLKLIDK